MQGAHRIARQKEVIMRLVIWAVMICGSAVAAVAEPVLLSNKELDRVSAGQLSFEQSLPVGVLQTLQAQFGRIPDSILVRELDGGRLSVIVGSRELEIDARTILPTLSVGQVQERGTDGRTFEIFNGSSATLQSSSVVSSPSTSATATASSSVSNSGTGSTVTSLRAFTSTSVGVH